MGQCIYCGENNLRPTSEWCSRKCEKKHRRQIFKEENRCTLCGKEKDSTKSICSKCSENANQYYTKNKELANKRSKKRYEEAKSNGICTVCGQNRPYKRMLKCKTCHEASAEWQQKYKDNPDFVKSSLLSRAKVRSKEFNLPFNLTLDDIIVPERCPILDIEIKCGKGKMISSSPSLDRVIPELGYVKGNVCVISQEANRLKSDLTKDTIFKILEYIDSHK